MKQYAPVVLFVYARPEHTRRTVEALAANAEASLTPLVVYADAARGAHDVEAVTYVREYVKGIAGFASLEVHEATVNKGLADSIIDGVTETVKAYGRAIVLEDDLITSPYFLQYMNEALELYENEPRVMHIAGHVPNIDASGLPETFFLRQSSCWGWATWERAWKYFSRDSEAMIPAFTPEMRHAFNLDGGYNYWAQLTANHEGRLKTWAVFWYASVFLQHGLCLHPRHTLVDNIGFDGSGENCGSRNQIAQTDQIYQFTINIDCNAALCENAEAASCYQSNLSGNDTKIKKNRFEQCVLEIEGTMRRLGKKILSKLYTVCDRRSPLDTFVRNGCLPWTHGYHEYKWAAIEAALAHDELDSLVGAERFGYRVDERIVEYPWFFSRLPSGSGTLLDAGSALNHALLVEHPKIVEKNFFISTLAHEQIAFTNKNISYVYEDLRSPCFRENYFDWICCISTLEHVGMDNTFLYTSDEAKHESSTEDYRKVIDALKICLKKNGRLFITVPYGKYKNHGWFQVFDSHMMDSIVEIFNPSSYTETVFQYINDRWIYSDRHKAKDAVCFDINVQKEYDDDYAAFSRGIACLELVK